MQTVTFENGIKMPMIGLGVFKIDDSAMEQAIKNAYEIGYRHFDTAQMYGNETALGKAWSNLGINREQIMLTTKINNHNQGYEKTLKSFTQSCKDLKTDYVDQLLIHWPGQNAERTAETWKAFEKLYEEGYVRVIGVSNFTVQHLAIIAKTGNIKPMSDQIERNPLQTARDILPYLKENHIVPIAWSPLRRGNLLENPDLKKIANKYHKTVAQVILRWNIESNVMVIPKSIHPERLKQNIDIFDFTLNEEEIHLIDRFHTGERLSFDPATYDF